MCMDCATTKHSDAPVIKLTRDRDQWNINRAPHFPSYKKKIEKEDEFLYLQENVCDELGTVASKHHHILQATLHDKTQTKYYITNYKLSAQKNNKY